MMLYLPGLMLPDLLREIERVHINAVVDRKLELDQRRVEMERAFQHELHDLLVERQRQIDVAYQDWERQIGEQAYG